MKPRVVMIRWGIVEEHWRQGGTGIPRGSGESKGGKGSKESVLETCHLQGEVWLSRCPEDLRRGVRAYFLKLGGDRLEWDEVYLAAGYRNGWELQACVNDFIRWAREDSAGPGTKKGPE